MDFNESAEHLMLREAVADIAGKFGHEYFAECTRTGREDRRAVAGAGRPGLPLRAPLRRPTAAAGAA